MDIFMEQLVEKKSSGMDYFKKGVFIVAGLALAIALMTFAFVTGLYLFLIISLGVLDAIVVNLKNFDIEYEYIVTNRELDIDKIRGKKTRKRLITISLENTEFFGVYNEKNIGSVNATVMATDGTDFNQYLLITTHKKMGKIAIVFSPNPEFLEAVKKGMPINIVRGMRNID